MRFPWSRENSSTGLFGRPAAETTVEERQKCPGLGKILDKLARLDKPEILDLGTFCGDTAVFLAGRGARVSVEEFVPPPPLPEAPPGKKLSGSGSKDRDKRIEKPPPLRLEQPDGKFHLVLVWELCDFISSSRLPEFGGELRRVLVEGGWVLLFSASGPLEESHATRRPPRYRVVDNNQVVRESSQGPSHKRYSHNPRDIERALAPLVCQGIHLQRNQLREFTMFKRNNNK